MNAIDTNVLVYFLDEHEPSKQALRHAVPFASPPIAGPEFSLQSFALGQLALGSLR
jgi:predicted nucleic acid-binding protein